MLGHYSTLATQLLLFLTAGLRSKTELPLKSLVLCMYLLINQVTGYLPAALSSWEWPPAVCGRHTDVISLRLSKTWCQTSYRAFQHLQEILQADGASGHGIRLRTANFFFDKPIESNPEELEKMQEIEQAKVRDRSTGLAWPYSC